MQTNSKNLKELKNTIKEIGILLWDKDLASGYNGNISVRGQDNTILMTAHGTCLGQLKDEDIIALSLDGEVVGEGKASTEKLLHTEAYKSNANICAIIHTHTSYTNGYFLAHDSFASEIYEAKICLGKVESIAQNTPAVTDAAPVIEKLKSNNIVVLKNHGAVACGKTLFDCFMLVQSLEEAIKTDCIKRIYQEAAQEDLSPQMEAQDVKTEEKTIYKMFSQEQIDEIVRVVNNDAAMKQMGEQTAMTMELAVKMDETGSIFSFNFENGKIVGLGNNEDAEFLISAPEEVWRAVFKCEIDPFVATTQKKMNLRGDFAKISKWYAPCSRIFELWTQVPVE